MNKSDYYMNMPPVAMSEYICGSEDVFVEKMNEKAKQLGMEQTHFVNCCGLDTDGHTSSARDVALMSRSLLIIIRRLRSSATYGWRI